MSYEAPSSADIYAHVRSVMSPGDREAEDRTRRFYEASAAFDAHADAARAHLDAMKAIGNRHDNSGVPIWLSPDF